jgi:hypothetical protein
MHGACMTLLPAHRLKRAPGSPEVCGAAGEAAAPRTVVTNKHSMVSTARAGAAGRRRARQRVQRRSRLVLLQRRAALGGERGRRRGRARRQPRRGRRRRRPYRHAAGAGLPQPERVLVTRGVRRAAGGLGRPRARRRAGAGRGARTRRGGAQGRPARVAAAARRLAECGAPSPPLAERQRAARLIAPHHPPDTWHQRSMLGDTATRPPAAPCRCSDVTTCSASSSARQSPVLPAEPSQTRASRPALA